MAKRSTKRQQRSEALQPSRLGETTSAHMLAMVEMIQATTGDPTATTLEDAGKFIIGLPLPSFAFEYLICNTVLPLEKIIQLYGPRGIGKSGLAFEMARWFRRKRGLATLLEHESKFNPDWAASIYGTADKHWFSIVPCDSIDVWQTMLQKTRDFMANKIMTGTAKEPGTGKIFPYLQIVDSIMGKPSEETSTKIETDGHAGRGHPVEALSLAKFIKMYAAKMRRWPFSLVCVNHQRVYESAEKGVQKTRTGGQTIDFQGSFEFEISRVARIRTAKVDGNLLKIVCEKNSYGEDKRSITVPVVWWDEPFLSEDGSRQLWKQKTVFDWDAATVQLIFDKHAKGGAKWTEAKKLAGLVFTSKTRGHSKVLGVSADEPASFSRLGRLIRERPEIVQGLRDLFNVRERKVFRNDMDYDDQLLSLKTELAALGDDGEESVGISQDVQTDEPAADE